MSANRPSSRWTLTRDSLEQLLTALHPDRDVACAQYERLLLRLEALFRFWGCADGADLADQTLDRVAVRLAQGAPVPRESLEAYLRGVARMLFHDSVRLQKREQALTSIPPPDPHADAEGERALATLDDCLDLLGTGDRKLILDYYAAHDGGTIDLRRRLASAMGISPTALRIRAHRIRQRLEACVEERMKRSASVPHYRREDETTHDHP
jgi:DNA-directed RNA polymerase specialized sigma24 family protein